jgi:hypothetical protein
LPLYRRWNGLSEETSVPVIITVKSRIFALNLEQNDRLMKAVACCEVPIRCGAMTVVQALEMGLFALGLWPKPSL